MKAMQDKDFDRLFAEALNDIEETPSEKVWAGIARKQNRSSHNLARRLSVAASLLLLFTAGLWYYNHNQKEKAEALAAKKIPVKTVRPAATDEWHQQMLAEELKDETAGQLAVKVPEAKPGASFKTQKKQPQKKHRQAGKEETEFKQIFAAQPEEPVLAALDTEQPDLQKAEAVHEEPVLTEPEKIADKQIKIPVEKARKIHHVRNLGDLVNLVVARVDKRQEKIIEFTDEDGQTSITGLNLGIINIQKSK